MSQITKPFRRQRIKNRIKKIVRGTAERPRLTVFRSNREFYAQLIDDLAGNTLAFASSKKNKDAQSIAKTEQAKEVGKEMAAKAKKAGISSVVFDRSGYLYHGRVKSFAEAAREGGLIF